MSNGKPTSHTAIAEIGGSRGANGPNKKRDAPPRYKHVLAIHKVDRTSYLTQGSPAAPSFVGFRNLAVLVIGRSDEKTKHFSIYGSLIHYSCFEPASDD